MVAAGAIVVALAVTGCTPSQSDPPPPDSRIDAAAGTSLHWADGSVVRPTLVDLGDARAANAGSDYEVVVQTDPGNPRVDYLMPLALDPSGALVTARVPADQYTGGPALLKPTGMGSLDDGRQLTWDSTAALVAGDRPRQVYAASTDQGVAAWAETASVRLDVSNWRIFTRGADGKVALLARSEDVFDGDLPLVNGDTTPVVREGRVYWATAAPADDSGSSFDMRVQSRGVDGSAPAVTEAEGASQPAPTADGLFVVRSSHDDATVDDGTATVERVTEPGRTQPFVTYSGPAGTTVQSLVGDDDRVAFVTSTEGDSGGVVYVLGTHDQTAVAIPLASSGRFTSLALCGDRLVWNSADGSGQAPFEPQYVMDLETRDVALVDVDHNYSGSYCSGDLVGWRALSDDPQALATTTITRWKRPR